MNKNIISAKIALRIGALSLGALSALAPAAFAHDRNERREERREERRDEKGEKRDVKEARRDVKRQRREVQNADSAGERRREQRDVQEAREELRRESEELRREKNDDSYTFGNGRRNTNGNNGRFNRPANRPVYNNGYGYNNNYGYNTTGGQRVTGTVTRVNSSQNFDIRVNNTVFNVYTTRALPRALSVGDVVRVSGNRVGGNDIRNAGFSIVTNR